MPNRRVLSLWFPRLAAERHLRRAPGLALHPFAVVAEVAQAQVLVSLSERALAEGLRPGQPLRDAFAMCPGLLTRPADPLAEAAFLRALRRWAGKFSPWVAEEAPDGLVVDLTGCTHLFGGEEQVMGQVAEDCADMQLSARAAIADTLGAAWALARHGGGRSATPHRSGDAIDQEARATRSRAAKRRGWERGGTATDLPAPLLPTPNIPGGARGGGKPPRPALGRIAPPGQTRAALAPLPIAALRLPEATVAALARVGLRRIEDLMGPARAPLARRFGREVIRRLDQALGIEPEPVSPARADTLFAVRLTLPEPIGLEADILAGLDRLLPPLCDKLRAAGRGARRVRLEAHRADRGASSVEVGLARPAAEPDRIRPLLAMKLDGIDAGFGIDMLRVEAVETEPVHARQHRGHFDAAAAAQAKAAAGAGIEDLIGRIGARVGLDAVVRLEPVDSHIPEKAARIVPAAWTEPRSAPWPEPPRPRPLLIFRPEPVQAPETPKLPARFRWRRRDFATASALGPERIAPEWWLDEPEWRSGTRDYWRVEAEGGERLWLFYAHGGAISGGWFCHGLFA